MSQLINAIPRLAEHQLQLVFMDCFGHRQDVFLSLAGGPSLAEKTASTIARMEASEATVKANAEAYGLDLTQALADGTAAIEAALASPKE